MADRHRTAVLATALLCGCRPEAEPASEREIRAHWLLPCAPADDGSVATIDLKALGDFDPSPTTSESLREDARGDVLVVPLETRAVELTAIDGNDRWRGIAEEGADGHIDVGLWPEGETCSLLAGSDYPPADSGVAMGYSKARQTLLLAGGGTTTSTATGAIAIGLATGAVSRPTGEAALGVRRSFATVTAFGPHMIVAGGENPVEEGRDPHATAEVFDVDDGTFDEQAVELGTARTRHGAVVLPSGETLLVAGRGADGRALRTLEAISPESRRARINGLADLERPRESPRVTVLTDGRMLVAGGIDDSGAPVGTLEWLSDDASRVDQVSDLLAAVSAPTWDRAFAALPGGSAVAVGGCALVRPEDVTDACAACDEPDRCPSDEAYWIMPDGIVTAIARLESPAAAPAMIGASDGRPWLVTGDAQARAFFRFEPWSARFEAADDAPESPPDPGLPALAVDPGLFVFLTTVDDRAAVVGYRHDVRGRFSQDVAPLIATGSAHVAPSRAPAEGIVGYDDVERTVTLADPGAVAIVTDTRYEDFSIELGIADGRLPELVFGDNAVGGPGCAWPGEGARAGRVDRAGSTVRLSADGSSRECAVGSGRVSIGVRSTETPTTVTTITVRRSADL